MALALKHKKLYHCCAHKGHGLQKERKFGSDISVVLQPQIFYAESRRNGCLWNVAWPSHEKRMTRFQCFKRVRWRWLNHVLVKKTSLFFSLNSHSLHHEHAVLKTHSGLCGVYITSCIYVYIILTKRSWIFEMCALPKVDTQSKHWKDYLFFISTRAHEHIPDKTISP